MLRQVSKGSPNLDDLDLNPLFVQADPGKNTRYCKNQIINSVPDTLDQKIWPEIEKKLDSSEKIDKEFIIERIRELEEEISIGDYYKFELTYENLDIIIYFDNQSLNLVGWSTIDIYQNKVETKLSIVEKNIQVDQKIFDIRNYTN